jgi:hypothetical protein
MACEGHTWRCSPPPTGPTRAGPGRGPTMCQRTRWPLTQGAGVRVEWGPPTRRPSSFSNPRIAGARIEVVVAGPPRRLAAPRLPSKPSSFGRPLPFKGPACHLTECNLPPFPLPSTLRSLATPAIAHQNSHASGAPQTSPHPPWGPRKPRAARSKPWNPLRPGSLHIQGGAVLKGQDGQGGDRARFPPKQQAKLGGRPHDNKAAPSSPSKQLSRSYAR